MHGVFGRAKSVIKAIEHDKIDANDLIMCAVK